MSVLPGASKRLPISEMSRQPLSIRSGPSRVMSSEQSVSDSPVEPRAETHGPERASDRKTPYSLVSVEYWPSTSRISRWRSFSSHVPPNHRVM